MDVTAQQDSGCDMTAEHVGQKARIAITRSRAVGVQEIDNEAAIGFEEIMSKVGCSPTDITRLWVKPLPEAVADGDIPLSMASLRGVGAASLADVDVYMYEATAT